MLKIHKTSKEPGSARVEITNQKTYCSQWGLAAIFVFVRERTSYTWQASHY